MARCALVRIDDNIVDGIIIAEATDPPPLSYFLVDVDYYPQVTFGWRYDPVMNDFLPPVDPEPVTPVDPEATNGN